MTKLLIAGAGASTDHVTFNQRFFGSSVEPPVPFVLASPFSWFAGRFTPIYDEALADLRAEQQATGKPSPYDGAKGYPNVEGFFALADKPRMEMVNAMFTLDILRLFFTQEAERARWAVRFVDSVAKKGGDIELRGRVEKL